MADRSSRRKRVAGLAGLTALAIATAGAVGFAVTRQGSPAPAASIDMARAEQAAKDVEARRVEREKAALEAATVPLVFPADGSPLRVLYSGDSLSEGYFTTAPEKAFRPLVTSSLRESGPVEEVGTYKAGATVRYVTENFPTPENIGLAVIELGTNDSRVEGGSVEFADRYDTYLADLKAKSPDVQIICLSVWAPSNTRTIPYNEAIEAACEKNGGRVLDLSYQFPLTNLRGPEGKETWGGLSDAAHPNDAGHATIATLIQQKIRR